MSEVKLDAIVSLAKRRGFIYPGSDVYGGLSGTWDYGPLGVTLKRNIMNLWWQMFVDARDDMYGVDAAILMNQKVWQASGHVDTFTDPMVEDVITHQRYRADHLLKDAGHDVDGLSLKQLGDLITQNDIKSPSGHELSEPETFNMMFKTVAGPKFRSVDRKNSSGMRADIGWLSEDGTRDEAEFILDDPFNELGGFMIYESESVSYLRPETAQGIFTNYKNVVDSFYPNLPFGIAQQGKAFRNEISPRDFIFRSREFEQMEIEYFIHPDEWKAEFEKWIGLCKDWFTALGLPEDMVHELEVPESDRAHYSERTIDFEFDFPIGREELMGLAYRTDFDLKNIHDNSGKNMEYQVKGTNEKFIPHVIEPSFGVERALMAVLTSAYREDEQNGETRVYLALPEHLAPVKYAVSPLLKNKPELVNKAQEVYQMLSKKHPGRVMWDDNGNIGKRYRRQDEIGTPYCVVIDFDTLEDGTVTVRDRDSTEQSRIRLT